MSTVAVIGLGAAGLVTVKNLAEEGFNVTGFEKNGYVGGLWKFNEEELTSVLPSTLTNVTKERFPQAAELTNRARPNHYPTAKEVEQYLVDFAEHFSLYGMLRLNITVKQVKRSGQKWELRLLSADGETVEYFDKIVHAGGLNAVPNIPRIEGMDGFGGDAMHSNSPSALKGKRVLVVGFGNTAADTATGLVGIAETVHLSHRHGAIITYKIVTVLGWMAYLPSLSQTISNKYIKEIQAKSFDIDSTWGIEPKISITQTLPVVSDTVVGCMQDGTIIPVPAIRKITGSNRVKFEDGSSMKFDSIIFCTGYKSDFSILGEHNPATKSKDWTGKIGSNGKPLPELYQNVFSLQDPDSLAFVGWAAFLYPAFLVFDLTAMAIAQVWKGRSRLPSPEQMRNAFVEHQKWVCALAARGPVYPAIVKGPTWMQWVNEAAGTGVDKNLGYGIDGWKFWWNNPSLCHLLMNGLVSPHIYRLFDGKRKKWDDAREFIEQGNRNP